MTFSIKRPWNKSLPKHDVMDSVMPSAPVRSRGWLGRLLCPSHQFTGYVRVDYRAGPGCFADIHEGFVCKHCGKIKLEQRTY